MPEKLITYTQKFTVYRTDGDHLGHVKLKLLNLPLSSQSLAKL